MLLIGLSYTDKAECFFPKFFCKSYAAVYSTQVDIS